MRSKRSRPPGTGLAALTKAFELSVAAPQVIALRSLMLAAPGAAGSAHTGQEVIRMSAEKVQAWQESMTAMSLQLQRAQQEWALTAIQQWFSAWAAPWRLGAPRAADLDLQRHLSRILDSGLAPVHRRATANAKRLARRKRRK